MTAEETAAEREADQEIMTILENSIIRSGYFKPERVAHLVAILKSGYAPFGRVNTRIAFKGEPILTVEEKRSLGLNTRRKYSRQFIEYFQPESLKNIEPHSVLEAMHLDAFHRVSRKKELRKLRQLGSVKQVKISWDAECIKIKSPNKIYPIESVPELPVPGCTAPFCCCIYVPVIAESL
jgi:hypothetical protein